MAGMETVGATAQPGPLLRLTFVWMGGILLGRWMPNATAWLTFSALLWVTAAVMYVWRGSGSVRHWALITVLATSAAWYVLRDRHLSDDHVGQFVTSQPHLVQVTGTIGSSPYIRSAQSGAFAGFSYEAPLTIGILELESILVDGQEQSCSGQLLVRIKEADFRFRHGIKIRAIGWLSQIAGPKNPGELDYRRIYRARDIAGRLTMRVRGNWQLLEAAPTHPRFTSLRRDISDIAAASLREGMDDCPKRLALLDTILLGRRSAELYTLTVSFRRVGLAHLLSISGAHLAILLAIVWALARLITGRPTWTAAAVIVALALFLAIVPWRVPIVRAAIMTGLFALGYGTGRLIGRMQLLALSALVVLIWLPTDLFNAGFQLSFGAVAGLILFAGRVGQWIWPDPLQPHTSRYWARGVGDYLAVNLVAFTVSLPLVAYHFQMVTPLAVLLSILALPFVTVTLGLGYTKVLAGLAYPTLGRLLAGPLEWITDVMMGLVEHASSWPGATIELQRPPSPLWVLAAVAVVVAVLSGWFAQRRRAAAASIGLCIIWLMVLSVPSAAPLRWLGAASVPPLRLNMLAVGDGSCYLFRIAPPGNMLGKGRPHVIIFDCGSQQYLSVGKRTVLPALRFWGVDRIDTLILSHADLDHFGGSLDVMDRIPVASVWVPPYLMAEAKSDESGAAAFLVEQLRLRAVSIETVGRGSRYAVGAAELEVLWPPSDLNDPPRNDTSIVLRVSVAGRHVLMGGDIQTLAIDRLLAGRNDLKADVCDLPHHGSFVDSSPRWLAAVDPMLVLQSCGRGRLQHDRWQSILDQRGTPRFITSRNGMVEVTIDRRSRIKLRAFLPNGVSK